MEKALFMSKTFAEKTDTIEKLKDLLRQNAIFIHYACEDFNTGEHLMSICVNDPRKNETRSFSVHSHCEGTTKKIIKSKYELFEKKMLEEFISYVNSKSNYNWIGWNIRSDTFGFQHIKNRIKALIPNGNLTIAMETVHDLSRIAWELYGDDYVPGPKLPALMRFNQISTRDLKNGKEEGKIFSKYSYKDYLAVNRSTQSKVEALSLIMTKMAEENIRVHPNEEESLKLKIAQDGRIKTTLKILLPLVKIVFRVKGLSI